MKAVSYKFLYKKQKCMLAAYTLYKAEFMFLSYISPLHRKRRYSTSS